MAVEEGTCGPALSFMAMHLRRNLKADTRANEQFNSLIRIVNERCRNIGLNTLDSRCAIKKELGIGTRCLRWNRLRPQAELVLNDAVNHHIEATMNVNLPGRWEPPPPEAGLEDSATIKQNMAISIASCSHLTPGQA